jgi:hypothetical protein
MDDDSDLSFIDIDDEDDRSKREKPKGALSRGTSSKAVGSMSKPRSGGKGKEPALAQVTRKSSDPIGPPAKRTRPEDDVLTLSCVGENAGANSTDAPPPKKAKLPSIPRKSISTGSSTPTLKPSAPPTNRPVAVKPKGSEVDLNDADEYNKLFGIGTGGSRSSVGHNFRLFDRVL